MEGLQGAANGISRNLSGNALSQLWVQAVEKRRAAKNPRNAIPQIGSAASLHFAKPCWPVQLSKIVLRLSQPSAFFHGLGRFSPLAHRPKLAVRPPRGFGAGFGPSHRRRRVKVCPLDIGRSARPCAPGERFPKTCKPLKPCVPVSNPGESTPLILLMVHRRTANPCTRVRFSARPPELFNNFAPDFSGAVCNLVSNAARSILPLCGFCEPGCFAGRREDASRR